MSETYFCPKCGAQMNLLTGGAYCPNCGHVALKWELDLPPAGLSPYETMLGVQTMAENIVEDSKEWKSDEKRRQRWVTILERALNNAVRDRNYLAKEFYSSVVGEGQLSTDYYLKQAEKELEGKE